MKILIAGCGKVGSTLIGQLVEEGHDVIVIDTNAEVLESVMEQYDVMGVQGNAANMVTLKDAGVDQANLLIAATNADEVNLLACLTAHGMNNNVHTIGRIRNPEYNGQAYTMRDIFALNMVINPERSAANEIARLLRYPGFMKIETFAKGNVEIVELRVDDLSPLKNVSLAKLGTVIHTQILVCMVKRGKEVFIPDGNFVLKEGDLIFVTAPVENLSVMLNNIGVVKKRVKRVLIAGGGMVSFYLASQLTNLGMACTIIENNRSRCEELAVLLPTAKIIHGDASSQEFLDREAMGDTDAVVTLTGLDELNIVISLFANARGVSQIMTKLSHAENNKVLDDMPIGSVISPKELASNHIVRYVRAMQNKMGAAIAVHKMAGGAAEAIELIVDEGTPYINTPLKNLKTRKDVLIVSITHVGKTEIPTGNSKYQIGDSVVAVTTHGAQIYSFGDLFEA